MTTVKFLEMLESINNEELKALKMAILEQFYLTVLETDGGYIYILADPDGGDDIYELNSADGTIVKSYIFQNDPITGESSPVPTHEKPISISKSLKDHLKEIDIMQHVVISDLQ
ncbi:MAG: hypothetical protein K6G43_11015 [Lachnospiraceae bacterium]|nr:hypothetical protein [Lachnospiraceae bacterium]